MPEGKSEAKFESKSESRTQSDALRPAVFLDRDGTICEEMGYINHISRVHVFPFAAAAIRRLNEAGVPVIVVTNQSGISRGIFPEWLVAQVHELITRELAEGGAKVDAYYYCSHVRQDNCDCRKPLTGLLDRAAREHGLRLDRSYVVGDRYGDVELAHRAGGKGVLVLTGYGQGEHELQRQEWLRQPDVVAGNLAQAVDVILAELK